MARSYSLTIEFNTRYQSVAVIQALLNKGWRIRELDYKLLEKPLDKNAAAEQIELVVSTFRDKEEPIEFNADIAGSRFFTDFYMHDNILLAMLPGEIGISPRAFHCPDLNFYVESIVGAFGSCRLELTKFSIEYR